MTANDNKTTYLKTKCVFLIPGLDNMEKHHVEYIFVDESGDLGPLGSKYFIVVAVSTHSPIELKRIIKRARERILKKKLRELPEIKANNSNAQIRNFVLTKVALCDCFISILAIPKTKIRDTYFQDKEKLYSLLCGFLFEHISLNAGKVEITIDKKHSNRLLQEDFNQYIKSKIANRVADFRIRHLESFCSGELQAVDFVAWAVHRKFTYNDLTYYELIKNKIRNEEECHLL
ncbi:MAG: DUF3800 domain-containing protein [Candidatus Micrarchaeota archaeon]